MRNIRDAFILWLLASAFAILGATLQSFAHLLPIPLHIACLLTALPSYGAAIGLIMTGAASAVAAYRDWKKGRK